MRGEYTAYAKAYASKPELPPRARRILHLCSRMRSFDGTTSACAENTLILLFALLIWWNYLRVRGEYRRQSPDQRQQTELPPRARRIPFETIGNVIQRGTTSACAENTTPLRAADINPRNYLRVRGEYCSEAFSSSALRELPPRARRIHGRIHMEKPKNGTTSACAENTALGFSSPDRSGNYLRVRGEYPEIKVSIARKMELPPRARRIHRRIGMVCSAMGTTSACAENTVNLSMLDLKMRNYLRVRGEYPHTRR